MKIETKYNIGDIVKASCASVGEKVKYDVEFKVDAIEACIRDGKTIAYTGKDDKGLDIFSLEINCELVKKK
jgi:hypothetical protein